MCQKNINAVKAESLQTILKASHNRIIPVVIDHMKRQRVDHTKTGRIIDWPRTQQSANFI